MVPLDVGVVGLGVQHRGEGGYGVVQRYLVDCAWHLYRSPGPVSPAASVSVCVALIDPFVDLFASLLPGRKPGW